jgi:DNA-binding MarR family transcriptional regulator
MDSYLDVMRWGEERLGVKLMTPEYEVTSMLFDVERITPLEMQKQFSGSKANFSNVLKSLEVKDVIRGVANPSDRRSKFCRLSEKALSILARQWSDYTKKVPEGLPTPLNHIQMMQRYSREMTQQLGIRQYTCEYQTLMYLNLAPGLASIACHDLVDVSDTKFNTCMASLVKSGFTYHAKDPADGRMRLYHLSDDTRQVMDELTARILAWFDFRAHFFDTLLRDVR